MNTVLRLQSQILTEKKGTVTIIVQIVGKTTKGCTG